MSILPTFMSAETEAAQQTVTTLDNPREYGIDFETGELTGLIVEGIEAIKVWIWNCLHSERYRYAIYSWQYGVEYEQYFGQPLSEEYLQSDCQTETEEALMVNPYITGISDFEASLQGTTLHITFTVETTLGTLEVSEDV